MPVSAHDGGRRARTIRRCAVRNIRRMMAATLLAFFISLTIPAGSAQIVSGMVVGTVFDSTEAIVPNAKVTVTNVNTRLVRTVDTDAGGRYAFPALPVGTYDLTASAPGFEPQEAKGIVLEVGQTSGIDIRFRTLGSVATTVNVGESALRIENETSSLAQVVNTQQIASLPLNGRNFISLASLGSGNIPAYQPGSSEIFGLMGRTDLAVHVGGGRADAVSILIDGVETRSMWLGTPSILLSLDAMQEFRVQKNMFEARYGQGSATINTVTKSGGNSLHGSVFEYIRNDRMDAANFFDNFFSRRKPPYRQNQFGASAGGPVLKNKLFFFGNYEGLRVRQGNTLSALVPTTNQLNGDLSGLASTKTDPSTGRPAILNPFTGQSFPNNQIPTAMLSSIVQKFKPNIPAPNTSVSGFNLVVSPSTPRNDDQGTGRLDYTISERDTIFGRYIYFNSDLLTPGIAPLYGRRLPLSGQNVAVQETHLFTPTLLNVFKFGLNRDIIGLSWENTPSSTPAALGIKNLTQIPIEYGLPLFSIAGYTGLGGQASNQGGVTNVFQFTDEISWTKGKHGISFGADIRRTRFQQRFGLRSNGVFSFDGRYTGSALADFLLGTASSAVAQQGFGLADWRSTSYNFFFQDDFKVTPRLTLNLGLRYEYDRPLYDINGREGYFDTSQQRMVVRLPTSQWPIPLPDTLVKYDPNLRRGIWKPDRNNWAPRLGFAYQVGDDTVLRGGFGIFYSKAQSQELQGKINFPPLVVTNTLVGSLGAPDVLIDRDAFPASTAITLSSLSPFSIDPSDRTSYLEQWNLGIQKSLRGTVLEVAYAGSMGHSLDERLNINQATLPNPANPTPIAQRRPFPAWGDILSFNTPDKSNFHSLQTRLERRLSKGASFLASYTWAHAIDTASRGSGGTQHQDIRNRGADRGNSDFDVRHRFALSYTYELPFGRGKQFGNLGSKAADKVVGGWSINGITTFMTGNRRSAMVTGDRANTGGFAAQRANLVPSASNHGNLDRSQRTIDRYFDRSAFAVTPFGTFGNSGRNIVETPGLNNWDLSILKNTPIGERVTAQFRAELFNVWNHSQFSAPTLVVESPFFGQVRSARDPRRIQLAIRLLW